jgi:hypothetical protein
MKPTAAGVAGNLLGAPKTISMRLRAPVHSGFKIARLVDIGDQSGLLRLPAQQRPGTSLDAGTFIPVNSRLTHHF